MNYRVRYSDGFARDLRRLDPQIAKRILRFLTDRVDGTDDPRVFGAALQGSRFEGLWRYRVGDWRIVVEIQDDELIVLALQAGHRREIYE